MRGEKTTLPASASAVAGSAADSALAGRVRSFAAVLVVLAAALAVYNNSFLGPFIFDDETSIVLNPNIRSLWPPWGERSPLLSPPDTTAAGRPVVSLTLAMNYALHGLDVRGYHVANLAFHILAALVLFWIVRTTLLSPSLESRFGQHATELALTSSLMWMVHPLLTESVDYVIERTEILMGLFLLLTLACAIRGSRSSRGGPWYAAAAAACVLGMGSKEVMVVAPFVVLLYDWIFLADLLREAWTRRRWLYAGLGLSWLMLIPSLAMRAHGSSAGFGFEGLTVRQYAASQPGVILHYLRLCFWPHPLVLDYFDWPVATRAAEVVPSAVLVAILLGATLLAVARRQPAGFLGAWFFLILAPTSSFLPLRGELAAERRMYLPLAAVVILLIVVVHQGLQTLARSARSVVGPPRRPGAWPGGHVPTGAHVIKKKLLAEDEGPDREDLGRLGGTWAAGSTEPAGGSRERAACPRVRTSRSSAQASGPSTHDAAGSDAHADASRPGAGAARWTAAVLAAVAIVALGRASYLRNRDYRSVISIWSDVIAKRPGNGRAHNNLGIALSREGRYREAADHFEKAVSLSRDNGEAEAYNNLGIALARQGRTAPAIERFEKGLRLKPDSAALHYNLADALAGDSRWGEAAEHYAAALRLGPQSFPDAARGLAMAHAYQGRLDDTERQLRALIETRPRWPQALLDLALILTARPDPSRRGANEAVRLAEQACELGACKNAKALDILASAYAGSGRFDEAVRAEGEARRLALAAGQRALASDIEKRLALYREGRARLPGLPTGPTRH